jgi:FkbM family methyltransferase
MGLDIKRTSPVSFTGDYLNKVADPNTVIDVGVADGTEALLHAFPSAYFVLIEPNPNYMDAINKMYQQTIYEYIPKGVGSCNGSAVLQVDPKNWKTASFLSRTALTSRSPSKEQVQVEVTTLDDLFMGRNDLNPPFLLKLDAEGSELDILKGGKEFLPYVDTVISEVSIAERFTDGYTFEDLILYMNEIGFYLYSILHTRQRRNVERQLCADILFKRRS